MKIKKELPQFKNEAALLVVAGRQSADFYLAFKGEISKIDTLSVKTPRYSDREGHFKTSGKGQVFSWGAVCEPQKEKVRDRFLRQMKDKFVALSKKSDFSRIYLFCPDYLTPLLEKEFSPSARKKVCFSFAGNYKKEHPFQLLKKIKEKMEWKIIGLPPKK